MGGCYNGFVLRVLACVLVVVATGCERRAEVEAPPEVTEEAPRGSTKADPAPLAPETDPPDEPPDRSDDPAPKPRLAPVLELGELLGRREDARLPAAGRYAGAVDAKQHRFITRERTRQKRIRSGFELDLRADGQVSGCAWALTEDDSTTSKYASRDGKAHRWDDDRDRRLGVTGSWTPAPTGDSALVTLTRLSEGTCDLKSPHEASEPIRLTCYGLSPDAKLPSEAIVCRLETEHRTLELAGLLLIGHERDGSWEQRRDLGRGPALAFPADEKPWLLLGAPPGLKLEHRDSRRTSGIELKLTTTRVTVPPA